MKALVTGAGGFCGRHMVRYLKKNGMDVYTLGQGDGETSYHHKVNDLADVKALSSAMKSIRPHYVFHLAGVARANDPVLFYKINTQYAVALVYAMEEIGLRDSPVLLVGTSAEYGMVTPGQLPIREDQPSHPYDHYGISKLAQTLAGLAACHNSRPIIMVRPFNIIGPGMPEYLVVQHFARQIVKILKGTQPAVIGVGNLESSRDFIDVGDVIEIYWRLIQNPSAYGEVINVCSGRATVIGDILSRLISLSGADVELRTDPCRLKSYDVPVHYGSNEKLRKILGRVPTTDLDVTLRSILEDLKNQ